MPYEVLARLGNRERMAVLASEYDRMKQGISAYVADFALAFIEGEISRYNIPKEDISDFMVFAFYELEKRGYVESNVMPGAGSPALEFLITPSGLATLPGIEASRNSKIDFGIHLIILECVDQGYLATVNGDRQEYAPTEKLRDYAINARS